MRVKMFVPWQLFVLILWLAPSLGFAGNEKGNGGNAVVCYADTDHREIVSVEMFDYWEMERSRPIAGGVRLGSPTLSVNAKIDTVLRRLSVIDPVRARRYRESAYEILDHLEEFLSDDVNPTPIEDDNPAVEPNEPCVKVQFAVQLVEPQPGKRRFQINRRLWNASPTTNDARAGLILHEVIYREALGVGHQNSDAVRYLNYALSTGFLSRANAEIRYERILVSSRFPLNDFCTLLYLKNLGVFLQVVWESREIGDRSYLVCPNRQIRLGALEIRTQDRVTATLSKEGNLVSLAGDSLEFSLVHPIGVFAYVREKRLPVVGKLTTITFRPNGEVRSLSGWTAATLFPEVIVNGRRRRCDRGHLIFGDGGTLQSCLWNNADFVSGAEGAGSAGDPRTPRLYNLTGSSRPVALRNVRLSEGGEVSAGTLASPIRQEFRGRRVEIRDIQFDGTEWIGKAISERVHGWVRHLGRFIAFKDGDPDDGAVRERWNAIAENHCRALGFDGVPEELNAASELSSSKHYIGPYTQLYEAVENAWIPVFDQKVEIVQANFPCLAEIRVNF